MEYVSIMQMPPTKKINVRHMMNSLCRQFGDIRKFVYAEKVTRVHNGEVGVLNIPITDKELLSQIRFFLRGYFAGVEEL